MPSCFVGLVLENCQLPYANHGHVVLANPSPILFYPISDTEIRCLVDVPGQKVPSISNGEMAHYLKTVVAPQVVINSHDHVPFTYLFYTVSAAKFAEFGIIGKNSCFQIPPELYDAFIATIDKGNIKTMPNRSMPADPLPTPGALLMGDAFNMRHPLTGGGMTVAFSDIVVLRDLLRPLRDLNDSSSLCKYLESFYTLRKVSNHITSPYNKNSNQKDLFFSFVFGNKEKMLSFFAASGVNDKYIGRCPLQGFLCITRPSEKRNA